MSGAGCVPVTGAPRYGSVGVWTAAGIERFDCNGVVGESIRAAIQDFHASQAEIIRGAAVMGGYMVRHYLGSQEYCDQKVTSWYLGNHLTGQEVEWDEASCVTVYYFWDEWNPGSNDQEIPEPYEGGGGPFYSPTDPEHPEPTIDTMPERDHTCNGVTPDGRSPNFKCLVQLTSADSLIVYDGLDVYLTPLSQISDSIQRLECDSMRIWFQSVRDFGDTIGFPLIWAGRTDSVGTDSVGMPKAEHYAQTNSNGNGTADPPTPQLIHIDPKLLSRSGTVAGKKDILRAMLHESVHSWVGVYHDHSDNYVEARSGYPNDPFFRTLEAADACVQ